MTTVYSIVNHSEDQKTPVMQKALVIGKAYPAGDAHQRPFVERHPGSHAQGNDKENGDEEQRGQDKQQSIPLRMSASSATRGNRGLGACHETVGHGLIL